MEKKKYKLDIIVILVVLLIGGSLFITSKLLHSTPGNEVEITVDGNVYGTYSLAKNQEIPIFAGEQETNVLTILDGCAYMSNADCPDHLCMKQGKISHSGQSIVCLPNKVVVTVKGSQMGEYDSIAQ